MNREPKGEGDWMAYAFHALLGTGKIKILDVVVLDSDGNLVEETGGFHLVVVYDGRVTPKKVKLLVQEFTEGFLHAEGIDVKLPLENIKLRDLKGLSTVLARANSQKYGAIRDLR
jgi:hypothetical protein